MMQHWDTIVIGAGVGGLTAAAALVRAGRQVLVLDRNPHPGGTAFVYRRRGFAFPMGPLGFSHPGRVSSLLKEVGGGEPLLFRRIHYRIRAFGLDVPISLAPSETAAVLTAFFPAEAAGLSRFFGEVKGFSPSGETERISGAEYLDGLIRDVRLRRILGSLGTREPTMSRPLLLAMWSLMVREGIWHVRGGMEAFCSKLSRAVTGEDGRNRAESAGTSKGRGIIRLGTNVAGILVRDGGAAGVKLDDGTEILAHSVVSNSDFKTTFLRLLDSGQIPSEWRLAVQRARQTDSILQVAVGINAEKADLSCFREATRLIYRRGDAFDGKPDRRGDGEVADPDLFARGELEISLWSGDEESFAPPGKASIVIRADAEYPPFAPYRTGWRKRAEGYAELKSRLAAALIREAENLVPGLGRAADVIDVATPLTFEDQGGRSEGAVAGWSWDHRDFSEASGRELIRTPVRGLYMAGYQAYSALFLGGVPTAMESGRRAARAVLDKEEPVEEIRLAGGDDTDDGA
jgi:phytoene dehydrogenase-like protein